MENKRKRKYPSNRDLEEIYDDSEEYIPFGRKKVDKYLGLLLMFGGGLLGFAIGSNPNFLNYLEKREMKNSTYSVFHPDLPEIRDNQSIVLHPGYLKGYDHLSYTLLTDIDEDGRWDLADRVHCGFTNGDYNRTLYYKKGYSPAQSPSHDTKVEFVDSEFFEPHQ